MLLDPGLELTLRPMKYPDFFKRYKNSIKNTWTVEEVDIGGDVSDLRSKMTHAERHLIHRLVAFFATGDSIVANNLALNLYKHINAPEARLYLSRQLAEEAVHVDFYLTLLDTYIPDVTEREQAFAAIHNIPSIRAKADFCLKHTDAMVKIDRLSTLEDRRAFVKNLYAYAGAVEGLFFFAAFAYVYYLRSRGMCQGLATGTNWVFRDEGQHMQFAFDVADIVRREDPSIFDPTMETYCIEMLDEAIACETMFAEDLLSGGVIGLSAKDMKTYLQFIADQRLVMMGYAPRYKVKNPFGFMEQQDVQELANFFERRVSAYQLGVTGTVAFDEAF